MTRVTRYLAYLVVGMSLETLINTLYFLLRFFISDAVWLKFQNYDLPIGDIRCYFYSDYDTDSINNVCFTPCLEHPECVSIVDVPNQNARSRCCPKRVHRWQRAPGRVTGIHHYEPYNGSRGRNPCAYIYISGLIQYKAVVLPGYG